jgi:prepilin-type N-terminal cleavage/methylation domain-containing protein
MRRSDQRAFTLIELMLVLVVMGLLAALSWEGQKLLLKKYQLIRACRELVMDLRAVQQQAVASRLNGWIDFHPEASTYSVWISGYDREDRLLRHVNFPAPIRFGFHEGVLGPPSHPSEISEVDGITFRENRAVFMPNGGLGRGAGTIYLTDASNENRTYAITISVSGRVRHYAWIRGAWK